jgi:hypothetical protein
MRARTIPTLAAGALVGVAAGLAVGTLRLPSADPAVAPPAAAVTSGPSTGQEDSITQPGRSAGSPTASGSAIRVTEHFTLVSASERTTRVDVGPKGRSPGDLYFATGRLYDVAGRRVVGHQHTECTVHPAFASTDPSAYELGCTIAFVLANVGGTEQQLVATGQFLDSGSFPVAGTGPYRFVRGQATMGEGRTKDGRDTWTFDLRLTP